MNNGFAAARARQGRVIFLGIARIGDTVSSCLGGKVFGERPPAGTADMPLEVFGMSVGFDTSRVFAFPAVGGMGFGVGSTLVTVTG